MEQGTEEWRNARAGHITSSMLSAVIAKVKSGEAAARRDYRIQLVTERLTGIPIGEITAKALEWGKANEPDARRLLEVEAGIIVRQCGFIKHPEIPMFGGSPDGLIGHDGGAEIKCPFNSINHMQTVIARKMPDEHIPQVQGNMLVTRRKWWAFVSYDPRMPPNLRLFYQRIERDDAYICQKLIPEIMLFESEVTQMTSDLLSVQLLYT